VIVVVGSPYFASAPGDGPPIAAGTGVGVASAAATAGATVELVGKVGNDPAGDAVVVALTRAGVGHAAVLRDPTHATPAVVLRDDAEDEFPEVDAAPAHRAADMSPLGLDPADLALALRYLNGFAVLVVADPVGPAALAIAAEAAAYAGAVLVVLLPAGTPVGDIPAEATIIGAPDSDPDGVFAGTVGAFAAALDAGDPPAAALRTAVAEVGWEPVRG
jgi:sugar/nucleoside kinase (ribokinase family)